MWPFEYMSPGTPVNKPDCETFNTIFRILNEIQGENCWIEKTADGSGWEIKLDLAAIGGAIGTLPTQSAVTENLFLMSDGESAVWRLLGPESLRSLDSEGEVCQIDLSGVGPDPSGWTPIIIGNPSGAGCHVPAIRYDSEGGDQFFTAQNAMDLLGDSTRTGYMTINEGGTVTHAAHVVSAMIRWQAEVSGTEFFKTGWVNLFNGDAYGFEGAKGKICVLGFPEDAYSPLFEYKDVSDVIGTGNAGCLAKFKSDGTLESSLVPERVMRSVSDAGSYSGLQGLIPVLSSDETFYFIPWSIGQILAEVSVPYDETYDPGGPNEQGPAMPYMVTLEPVQDSVTPGVYNLEARLRAMIRGPWSGDEDEELVMLRLTGSGTEADPYTTRLESSGYTIESLLSASLPDPGETDNKVVFYDQDIANQGANAGWKAETRQAAFNVAFGTSSGTAAAGNHTHTPAEIGASATTHNHNLADLAERSYNSLTDKPDIPGSPDNIEVLLKSIGSFDPDQGSTNYMPLYLRWTGTAFLWDDLCDSSTVPDGSIAVWSNTDGESAVLHSEARATGFNKALGTTSGTVAEGNHNHTLASLSERSYNSLTDKPDIPGSPDNIEVLLKSIGSFDPTESASNFMPLYLRWTGSAFLWDDLCDSAVCTDGGLAIWSNSGTGAQLLSSEITASTLPHLAELTVQEIAAAGIPLLSGQKIESSFGFKISTDAASTSDTDLVTAGYVAAQMALSGSGSVLYGEITTQGYTDLIPIVEAANGGKVYAKYGVKKGADAIGNSDTDLVTQDHCDNWFPHFTANNNADYAATSNGKIAVWNGYKTLIPGARTIGELATLTYVDSEFVKGSFSAGNNVVMVADSYSNTIKKSAVLITDLVSNGSSGLSAASTYMVMQKKSTGAIGFDWLRAH